ncbi:eCIS core domain-containing protein [Actinosynnema sp. CS-041913]|uniref:eCIS core domain-containing protein n=1 Tax=Actinosynnema sp. CS-041913 TaxID=3239917 RepID=UPI003D8A28B3
MQIRDEPKRQEEPARRPTDRAPRTTEPPTAAVLLALQRTVGNAAVAGLLTGPHAVQRSAVHEVLGDAGRPLDEPVRAEMETRLGADFSDVRLHTGTTAQRSADEVGARAFTSGNHVVIGDGGTDKHTLAHELVHVIQQRHGPVAGTDRGDGIGISDPGDRFEREAETTAHQALSAPVHTTQRLTRTTPTGIHVQRVDEQGQTFESLRLRGNARLEAINAGVPLQEGDRGTHVAIIQQALADMQFPVAVNGRFEPELGEVISNFQDALNLPATGVLDRATMAKLDGYLSGHLPERMIATDTDRGLDEGTRNLGPGSRHALLDAITIEQRGEDGALPEFQRDIPGRPPYEVRIRDFLEKAVTLLYDKHVKPNLPRDERNLMAPAEINRVASAAKAETDAVFGRYKTGPDTGFTYGVNMLDHFELSATRDQASPALAQKAPDMHLQRLLDSQPEVRQIDVEHGAVQSRDAERALIARARAEVVADRRAELVAIEYHWPGTAGDGKINLQRFRGPNAAAHRDVLYKLFGIVIHEYMHTLEHPDHVAFRLGLSNEHGGKVLREGIVDYFAKMVWDGLAFEPDLRRKIEGDELYDPDAPPHPIPLPTRYIEIGNAGQAVGIVGIRNAMAAFFLGQTHLLRMP